MEFCLQFILNEQSVRSVVKQEKRVFFFFNLIFNLKSIASMASKVISLFSTYITQLFARLQKDKIKLIKFLIKTIEQRKKN